MGSCGLYSFKKVRFIIGKVIKYDKYFFQVMLCQYNLGLFSAEVAIQKLKMMEESLKVINPLTALCIYICMNLICFAPEK